MLQQLNSIIAAKPSEKAVVRQGECWLFMTVLHVSLSWIIYVLHTEMSILLINRGGRGSCMHPHLLDQQMGGLL